MNKRKITIISVIVVIAIVCGGFGIYKYNKVQAYNNLINTANKDMDKGEYDQAIALFNQALQYKNDPTIEKNIKLAASLKEVKSIFDEGTKLMNDKKYLEAIEQFKKVTKGDDKLYSNAQKSIEECKKQFAAQNIQLAKDALKNNKSDDANKYLDEVLKVDSNNAEAKKLKDDVKQKGESDANAKAEVKKANVDENANDPYAWAAGIQSKFEDEMIKSGYVDSPNNLRYEKSSISNNQGYYKVYAKINGQECYLVSVNVKTGDYHG